MRTKQLALVVSFTFAFFISSQSFADGFNSDGPTLPIGAGGTVELTINAPVAPSTTGILVFNGAITEGSTTINTDGSTVVGSNIGTDPVLSVNGDVRLGNSVAACTGVNAGAIQWTGTAFEGCNGTAWGPLGSSKPRQTEVLSTTTYNQGPPGTTLTSAAVHDLCVLSGYDRFHVSGNGYMSDCDISGTPGTNWQITIFGVAEEVTCTMTCYDF